MCRQSNRPAALRLRVPRRLSACFCTLLIALSVSAQEPVDSAPTSPAEGVRHWNQWRGPDRSGHSPAPAWPAALEGRLRETWRVELGAGYSGPVVDGARVYTLETEDGSREVARAFDRETGEPRWAVAWEGAIQVPPFAARNGSWTRSTPVVAGGAVYFGGMRDVLVCLDAGTGAERWRVDCATRFDAPRPEFGLVCSPLVDGGCLYVQAGGGVLCLDAADGTTRWRALADEAGEGVFGGAFASPVMAELAGRRMLLVQGRTRLHGLDPDSGAVLWSRAVRTDRGMNILTPQPFGDGVFTTAYGGRAVFFELAVDEESGAVRAAEGWRGRAQGFMTSPVVVDGDAYLFLRSQRFSCVDLVTGATRWTSGPMGDRYWSLVAQGDRILALADTGVLRLIRASPESCRVEERVQLADDDTWAHLAVDGGQIFVRALHALVAYEWR